MQYAQYLIHLIIHYYQNYDIMFNISLILKSLCLFNMCNHVIFHKADSSRKKYTYVTNIDSHTQQHIENRNEKLLSKENFYVSSCCAHGFCIEICSRIYPFVSFNGDILSNSFVWFSVYPEQYSVHKWLLPSQKLRSTILYKPGIALYNFYEN